MSEREKYPYPRREGRGRRPWVCGGDPVKFTIFMPGDLFDQIYRLSKSLDVPMSEAARRLLRSGLAISDSSKTE